MHLILYTIFYSSFASSVGCALAQAPFHNYRDIVCSHNHNKNPFRDDMDITAYSLPIISEHSLPAFQCIVYQLEVGLKKIFQPKVYHSLVGYS